MNKQKNPRKKTALKILGAAALLLLLLPGVYLFGMRYIGSKTVSLALFGAAVLGIAGVTTVCLVMKNKEKRACFLKTVVLVAVGGLVFTNLATLVSPYFIPHHTTTIQNRYYPVSLKYMAALQQYTQDKTVWVDASNDYLDSDSEKDTATDFSNRAAVHYASAEIRTLAPSPGPLSEAEKKWLMAKKGEYLLFEITYDKGLKRDRIETSYVYTGMRVLDYSDIVFCLSETGDAYWMPMPIYEQMKGETDGK